MHHWLHTGDGKVFNRNARILSLRSKSELVDFAEAVFQRQGAARELGVQPQRLRAFVRAVSRRYHNNSYHNFHHAVDATNTMGWLLTRPTFARNLPPLYAYVLLVAILVHDMDHPGNDNQWEVKTRSALARKYNDSAVLEHHSVDVARRLMAEPETDPFADLPAATYRRADALLEELVLATDFARHRDFLEELSGRLDGGAADFSDPAFLSLVARSLIKAADIHNAGKPFMQAKTWGKRIIREFMAQGEREKQHQLPLGPLGDPSELELHAAQAAFIRQAMELFELLARVEGEVEEVVTQLQANKQRYEREAARLERAANG